MEKKTKKRKELPKFGIVKTMSVDYYFHIEAKNMKDAKRKAKQMEIDGELIFEEGYNWIDVQRIEVQTWEEFGKPNLTGVGEEVNLYDS